MQIDFLAYMDRPAQLGLWDKPNELDIEAFFASLTPKEIEEHKRVWRELECRDDTDRFLRWIFAYCSVHTTYQNNMKGFLALKKWWEWVGNPAVIKEKIESSGMGLHNRRTNFLTDFTQKYWADPAFFQRGNESWVACRNRIVDHVLGLGKAKVSFALEMVYTEQAEVFCADVHLFRAYGKSQDADSKQYEAIESHWIQQSKIWNVPSAIARAIYWNRLKKQPNCLYWANVLAC